MDAAGSSALRALPLGRGQGPGLRVFDAAAGTAGRNKAPVVGRARAFPAPTRPGAGS
jgi:hypothetical protein